MIYALLDGQCPRRRGGPQRLRRRRRCYPDRRAADRAPDHAAIRSPVSGSGDHRRSSPSPSSAGRHIVGVRQRPTDRPPRPGSTTACCTSSSAIAAMPRAPVRAATPSGRQLDHGWRRHGQPRGDDRRAPNAGCCSPACGTSARSTRSAAADRADPRRRLSDRERRGGRGGQQLPLQRDRRSTCSAGSPRSARPS